MEEKICPKCGNIITFYPAISREDNKTEICSDCGVIEALEIYKKNIKQQESGKKVANNRKDGNNV